METIAEAPSIVAGLSLAALVPWLQPRLPDGQQLVRRMRPQQPAEAAAATCTAPLLQCWPG